VRGIGGAAINVPSDEGTSADGNSTGTGLKQFSFSWWNGAVPLVAILGLFGLSRMRFGLPADELKAIVAAQGAPSLRVPSAPAPAVRTAQRPPPPTRPPSSPVTAPPRGVGNTKGARLVAVDRIDPVPAEYSLMKDEISIGRGEDNDVVIPHASVSRQHARLMRRDGGFELMDLNSTNGSYVDDRQIRGSAFLSAGSQVRLGDIRFVLQL
jgi:hypothetical protein